MDIQTSQTALRCPRCGYDLHGLIGSWKRECPISGVCSECGLEFEWGALLCPRRAVPRWCVEYTEWWRIPLAAIKTVIVMLWPRKFWRDLKMVHQPRWRRFLALALMVLFMLYIVLAFSVGFQTYKQFLHLRQDSISTSFHPVVYGLYATINPFSNYEYKYQWPRSSRVYLTDSPRSIAKRLRLSRFIGEVRTQIRVDKFTHPFRGNLRLSAVIVLGLMLFSLCPLAFVALPQSLRKAKVRWQHLVRIALYSALIIVPPLGLYISSQMYLVRRYPNMIYHHWRLPEWLIPGCLVYVLAGLILWWSLAAKHYLKLPHAWGVGVSMVILAYVVGSFLVSLIDFVMM